MKFPKLLKRKLKKYCKVQKFTQEEYKEYFFIILGWHKLKDGIKIYLN